MHKEVECKILGITVEEFSELCERSGVKVEEVDPAELVRDEYWEFPNGTIVRFRSEGEYWKDLTIKGAEENDGKYTSEREELILRLLKRQQVSDITSFLEQLGGRFMRAVEKSRSFIYMGKEEDILVQHDHVKGTHLEWVEIEAPTRGKLHDFLFRIMDHEHELRKKVTNKTTLDLIPE